MISSFREKLAGLGKSITPGVITIFLIIAGSANIQIPGFSAFVPLFAAMSVFYWGIYWPDMMPKWFVFVIGLFQDALYGTPAMGMTSLLLLLLWGIVVSQRRHLIKEPFLVIWSMFTLSIILFIFFGWVIFSLYLGEATFSSSSIMQFIFSVLFYPLVHKIFNAMHLSFLKA